MYSNISHMKQVFQMRIVMLMPLQKVPLARKSRTTSYKGKGSCVMVDKILTQDETFYFTKQVTKVPKLKEVFFLSTRAVIVSYYDVVIG